MKKVVSIIITFLLCSALFAQNNDEKFKGWKQTKTEHFTFVYEDASREATEGYVKIADDAWNKVAKIYSIPRENIRVYVTGRTNTVNAFTYFAPLEIGMFTNPCTLTDFGFRDNWQKLFFTHELIHAANCSFEDNTKWPEYAFGPYVKALDMSVSVNGWALEGLTTVLETELTNGGRGRSPYFELDYKAPTLDNGFISYEDIGMEKEPPRGQSYVMGYLIMRSIADRYGIEALADIERNRKNYVDYWEDAVKLVTGETAQDIYRDVRIALAKKYADERKIPEGIIITPRNLNTSYYRPAIVLDDGTFISVRTARGQTPVVVRFDPSAKSGRNYLQDTKPEENLNTVFKETILFTGTLMDGESVTADEKGNVYTPMAITSYDKMPGPMLESSLYVWNEKEGLRRLTKETSIFQPSVSRDGNVLVAVEQKGMQMRLVKINTESGEVTSLLEDKNISFMQPNVNADGTKVAFLEVSDERARVAVLNLDGSKSYEIVANNEETIYDPTNPIWNSDGLLTYTSNQRGRLETFEITQSEEGNWISTPVISDPIGSTWAYKNDKGIYYTSKASNGYVIKMKPLSEWGVVADFEGPSPAGEKICFGHLENDYPDFKPYTVLSEIEEPEKSKEEKMEELKNLRSKKEVEKPIPVKGKTVKHRKEENIKKAEEANSAITEIQEEKPFIPLPQPLLYTPFVGFVSDTDDTTYFGPGLVALGATPKLQLSTGVWALDAFYYPKINNWTGMGIMVAPVGNSVVSVSAIRMLVAKDYNAEKMFFEKNVFSLGASIPIVYKQYPMDNILISSESSASFRYNTFRPSAFTSLSQAESLMNLSGKTGFELDYKHYFVKDSNYGTNATASVLADFGFDSKDFILGYEGSVSGNYKLGINNFRISAKARYIPVGGDSLISESMMTYAGEDVTTEYPLRLLPSFEILSGATRLYLQTLESFGNKGFVWDNTVSYGAELGFFGSLEEICLGVSSIYNLEDDFTFENLVKNYKLYFTFKAPYF